MVRALPIIFNQPVQDTSPPARRRVALHEAGHVIVGLALGVRPTGVVITEQSARTEFDDAIQALTDTERAAVFTAGMVASPESTSRHDDKILAGIPEHAVEEGRALAADILAANRDALEAVTVGLVDRIPLDEILQEVEVRPQTRPTSPPPPSPEQARVAHGEGCALRNAAPCAECGRPERPGSPDGPPPTRPTTPQALVAAAFLDRNPIASMLAQGIDVFRLEHFDSQLARHRYGALLASIVAEEDEEIRLDDDETEFAAMAEDLLVEAIFVPAEQARRATLVADIGQIRDQRDVLDLVAGGEDYVSAYQRAANRFVEAVQRRVGPLPGHLTDGDRRVWRRFLRDELRPTIRAHVSVYFDDLRERGLPLPGPAQLDRWANGSARAVLAQTDDIATTLVRSIRRADRPGGFSVDALTGEGHAANVTRSLAARARDEAEAKASRWATREGKTTGRKRWVTDGDRDSRHAEVNGLIAGPGRNFQLPERDGDRLVRTHSIHGPRDHRLPVGQSSGCRCGLEYEVLLPDGSTAWR